MPQYPFDTISDNSTLCFVPSIMMFLFVLSEVLVTSWPGCTVAAVSAKWPVEHVKNVLQNITTEGTKHSVHFLLATEYGTAFVTIVPDFTVLSAYIREQEL